jgi:hypothetical protein
MNLSKIKSIKKISISNNRYDITVDDFSCYFANNILIHNTDGQNIMISWKNGKLVSARNKSHLKNYGQNALDINDISKMFDGRGEIKDAFVFAMEDLQSAISKLSDADKFKLFEEGKKFMSVEVIYPATENTIPYNSSMLIFHGTIEYDENGNPVGEFDKSQGGILTKLIQNANADIQAHYQIKPANSVQFKKSINFNNEIKILHNELDEIRNQLKLKDSNTLGEYLTLKWARYFTDNAKKYKYRLSYDQLSMLSKKFATGDSAYNIRDIKNSISNLEFKQFIADSYNKRDELNKSFMYDIEIFVLRFGVQLLKNMSTFLAANPTKSAQKLKTRLDATIKELENSKDPNKIEKLKYQLKRLTDIGGMEAILPTEGIVFMYNGKLYKLTGSFAPVNNILGMKKYAKQEEQLTEGGNITDDFKFKIINNKR